MAPDPERFAYAVCGVVLESNVRLDVLPQLETAFDRATTVRFRRTDKAPDHEPKVWALVRAFPDEEPWLSIARLDDGYLLRVHGEADFWVDLAGTEIVCMPEVECDPESVEQLLLDQILPQVLHLRGQPSFHASAVALEGTDVIAFLGPSGRGKSTLAASFAPHAAIVSDDCLVVTLEHDPPRVLPSYPSVRLLGDSATAVARGAALYPVAPRSSKLRLAIEFAQGALSLRRLYLLDETDGDPRIDALRPRDAVVRLAEHLHRLDPGDRQRLVEELSFLEALVQRVPVARLSYRRDFDHLGRVHDLIRADLALALAPR